MREAGDVGSSVERGVLGGGVLVWRLRGTLFKGLTFKVADLSERDRALDLRRKVYEEDLGHMPVDRFDAGAHTLIALDSAHEVVACFRVVGPEQRPFDLEKFFNLNDLIGPDRTPALIGRLCIRRDYRPISKSTFVQLGMLKLSFAFARKHGISDFFLYTYPNLISFYRGAFFRLLEGTFEHPDWGEVHLMHLDLISLADRQAQSDSPLAQLLLAKDVPGFQV